MSYGRHLSAAAILALGANPALAIDWQHFAGSEVTVLSAEHPVTDGIRTLLPGFEAATGITVEILALPEDRYQERLSLALEAPSGIADVYLQPMDSTAFTRWAAGLTLPLSPYLDDPEMTAADYDLADFPDAFLAATRYPPGAADALAHAIPVSFETAILYYNQNHIDAYLAGQIPPTTYHLVDAATLIGERSGGEVDGAVMRGRPFVGMIDTATAMVLNACTDLAADLPFNIWFDGSWAAPRVTAPCIATGLAQYAGMMQAGPPDILDLDGPAATAYFQAGGAGFFIDSSRFGAEFAEPSGPATAGRIGYVLLPPIAPGAISQSGHRLWGLAIPANAPHPDAAWHLVQWMTSKAAAPVIGAMHGGAPRHSTWDNPDYRAAFDPQYVAVVRRAMLDSRSTAVLHKNWPDLAAAIATAIHEMHATSPPEAATIRLQARISAMPTP